MDGEIVTVMEQFGPYLSAASGSYGADVISRAEDPAVGATANAGRRLLRTVWWRRPEQRAEPSAAVREVAREPADEEAVAALRGQIEHALREDADLLRELGELLRESGEGTANVTASVEGSHTDGCIGLVVTGDRTPLEG